jgi:apolipoprotein N-acyltransferase
VLGIHKRAWGLCLVSAVLQILIFPLPGLYFLCWIALAPLFLALVQARPLDTLQIDSGSPLFRPASPLQGFVLGHVCGTLWCAGSCSWVFQTMRQYGGLSAPVAATVTLVAALYLGLYQGLFGLLFAWIAGVRSPVRRYAVALAPVLWVAVELARTRISAFPWNLVGSCQVDNIPLSRFATLAGVYGVSFEIALVNSALATAFLLPRPRRNRLLIAAAIAAAFLQTGRWMHPPPSPADRLAVLVQQNIPIQPGGGWTTDYFQHTLDDLRRISIVSSSAHPDLIVWPESPAPFYTADPIFRQELGEVARDTRTWVIAGSLGSDPAHMGGASDAAYNSAALFNPEGELVARYDKVHLVPFGEYVPFRRFLPFADVLTKEIGDFTHGASRAPLATSQARLGVFICYESVFPDEVRRFALGGAEVFVNISNDGWYGDSGAWAQHLQQARMRAVENNRWLLRGTNTGYTATIDPFGRIVAGVPRQVRTRLDAPYALTDNTTFYTRHGDWFAYGCAIIFLGAALARIFLRSSTS